MCVTLIRELGDRLPVSVLRERVALVHEGTRGLIRNRQAALVVVKADGSDSLPSGLNFLGKRVLVNIINVPSQVHALPSSSSGTTLVPDLPLLARAFEE